MIRRFRLFFSSIGIWLLWSTSGVAQGSDFFELDSPCNPISLSTCALPLPSDVYTIPDNNSPTGRIIQYPEGAIRDELFEQLPVTLTPQKVFNGSSGYSAATTVLFELDSPPDLSTLPADGGEAVVAFNLDTGERVPIRAQINEYARSRHVSKPSQVVEIYPRSRWQFANRYVVFVTDHLKPEQGNRFTISDGFAQAISADQSKLSQYYEPILQYIESRGYSRHNLISATFFTVRDESEVTNRLLTLGEYTYQQDHPIRNLHVIHKVFGYVSTIVTGEVLVYNFRDEYGGMIWDTDAARENWIKFTLTLPRAARKGPVPVSIFSHGLGMLKETGNKVALSNARMGIATIAIDHPNHGSRIGQDGGFAMFKMQTRYVPLQVGMISQSPVDHMSLLKALKTSIGTIDVLPRRFWSPLYTRDIHSGDGIADLDLTRIFYQGISLGGVLGSSFLSIAPDIKGAFLKVPGIGITNILSGSALWDPFFSRMVPDIADGAEALLLKGALQHELDYADAINFVHYIRNPKGIASSKPVALVAGKDDGVVPNFSTVALAELVQIPLVGEQYFPMPGTTHADDFVEGFGAIQYQKDQGKLNDFWYGIKVHFGSEDGRQQEWIERFILEDTHVTRHNLPEAP